MNSEHALIRLAVPVNNMDHVIGSEYVVTTLVEYGDFDCPTCERMNTCVRALLTHFPQQLRFVFRHFPDERVHSQALIAAQASEAAAAQGRFWEMYRLLSRNSRQLARRHLDEYAASLGLNLTRFKSEMDEEVYRQRVREHQDGARRSYVRGPPAFFVDGVMVDGSVGMHQLYGAVRRQVLRRERAPRSGQS
jgi:protein-disulfide isomerase